MNSASLSQRRLILVRHAKSSWDYAELSDFERPLNPRGRRDAPEMAARLAEVLEPPLRLVSSPALRAITTAHAFADALLLPREQIHLEPRIYEASAGALLRIVRQLDPADSQVLLFGHNPGFSDLAVLLAASPIAEMPTCAVLRLRFAVDAWSKIKERSGEIEGYDFPKKPA
jgi:phosphohistidine phosphatase